MKKVFLSYSTKNQELAETFIEFLQLGMGMRKNDIFCTAFPEMLETGEGFIEKIRKQIQECPTVISIITEDYLKSPFCLVELGVAWAMSKSYFPVLTVPYESLNRTPLQGMQMRKLDSVADMSVIYDELHKCGAIEEYQTAEFNRRVSAFVRSVRGIMDGDFIIEKDSRGYYEAAIASVREVKQKQYRCYGIKGHIADPPDGGAADSDWLFYWENAFPDLQVGDRVRFKTTKSKIYQFQDLGRARNIFPDELEKLEN